MLSRPSLVSTRNALGGERVALARSAMACCWRGGIIWARVVTRYHDGLVCQAGSETQPGQPGAAPVAPVSASTPNPT